MELKPGEVYEDGNLFIFDSQRSRDVFYHPPDRKGCPLIFDTLEGEDRFYHPERYIGGNAPPNDEVVIDLTESNMPNLTIPPELVEVEVLPPSRQTFNSPPSIPFGMFQVAGTVHNHYGGQAENNEQTAETPKRENQSKPSVTLNPMEMAEKLVQMECFTIWERNLYMYDRAKGIYSLLDRDDTKGIVLDRLTEDLRIKGTANQIRDIYEFVRLNRHLNNTAGPPKDLLAFRNGVLNLHTGQFTPGHSPDVFLTWRFEIPFVPEAQECPNFQALVQRISGGDPILIARMLEIMAFLLIPCSFTKGLALFQGISNTGKSVVDRLIASFLDPSVISRVPASKFDERFPAATLQGKQLNSCMDLPGGKIGADAVAFLKMVTGGDEVFVESKGVDGHSAHLNCRFLFGTNHAFVSSIRDDAFTDRIILMPFLYPVPPAEVDTEIDGKLRPERPAIFNLILEAFYRLQRNNFQFTGEDQYGIRVAGLGTSESDPLLATFIRERCIFDSAGQVPTSILFGEYQAYLAERGCTTPWNSQQFSRAFNEITPESVATKKIRIDSTPTNCYIGISLKGESDD